MTCRLAMSSGAVRMSAGLLMLAMLGTLGMLVTPARGHGSMYEPPARGAMSRFGFNNPPDPNHWENNCGGREEQWDMNGGRCGVCGDPWSQAQPRDHENGGVFGNGIIARNYHQGQTIAVTAYFSISHKGSIAFSLCPLMDLKKPASEECFARYPLRFASGEMIHQLPKDFISGQYNVTLVLPRDVTCKQCVLRWKYRAGNDWGCDAPGDCCTGCGKRQEEFYACADVAIYPRSYKLPPLSQGPPSGPVGGMEPTHHMTHAPPTYRPRPPYSPVTSRPPTRYPTPAPTPYYKDQPWAGDNSIVPIDKCPVMFCRVICRSPEYCPPICPVGCRKFQQ